MTTSTTNTSSPLFNTSLAATLYPQLVHLAELSSLVPSTTGTGDEESRVSKLDLGKAVRLRLSRAKQLSKLMLFDLLLLFKGDQFENSFADSENSSRQYEIG